MHLGFRPDYHRVAHVTTLDLVREGGARHARGVGTAIFLDDDDDSVACEKRLGMDRSGRYGRSRTYPGGLLLADDHAAFDDGSTGIVDAIQHCLGKVRCYTLLGDLNCGLPLTESSCRRQPDGWMTLVLFADRDWKYRNLPELGLKLSRDQVTFLVAPAVVL